MKKRNILTIIILIGFCACTTIMTSCSKNDTEDNGPSGISGNGSSSGHKYVDLGLPSGTLWATCNIGANSPEEYGDYFAWGETKPKNEYSWDTYIYCKRTDNTFTKYCTDRNKGYNDFTDNLIKLLPEDDAATANWGEDWWIPSKEQFDELINDSYTTKIITTLNNVSGMKITSIFNKNYIFLPYVDFRGYFGPYDIDEEQGSYWSCSLYTSYPKTAYYLAITSRSRLKVNSIYRSCGLHIRPVRKP